MKVLGDYIKNPEGQMNPIENVCAIFLWNITILKRPVLWLFFTFPDVRTKRTRKE